MSAFVVDGQRQPRAPASRIEFLDAVGLDRRMTPQPLVFEHDSMAPFYAAGGWIETEPMPLGEEG